MLQAISKTTTTLRKNKLIPAGTPFPIEESERQNLEDRGYTVTDLIDDPPAAPEGTDIPDGSDAAREDTNVLQNGESSDPFAGSGNKKTVKTSGKKE